MPKFRVINGSHFQGETLYRKGEVFTSKEDVAALFPDQIALADDTAEPAKTPAANKAEATPEGKDVTAEFEDAEAAGLKIFKHNRHYSVYDAENLETAINTEPLKSKDEVETLVAKY